MPLIKSISYEAYKTFNLKSYFNLLVSTSHSYLEIDQIIRRFDNLETKVEKIQSFIDEIKAANSMKSINNKSSVDKKRKERSTPKFTVPLKLIIDALLEVEYLKDEENAKKMLALFSKETKQLETKIKWNSGLRSLITFLFFSDRLGYIERTYSREHNTSVDEIKEHKSDEYLEISYLSIIKHNFEVTTGACSDRAITQAWGNVQRNIDKMRERLAKDNNIKKGDEFEEYTRKEAIIYYFKKKDNKDFDLDNGIEIKMLNVMNDLYKKFSKPK